MVTGAGRAADEEAIDAGLESVSASAIPAFYRLRVTTRPLTTEEIEKILETLDAGHSPCVGCQDGYIYIGGT